jgi:hypothetical protein
MRQNEARGTRDDPGVSTVDLAVDAGGVPVRAHMFALYL